MNRPMEGEGGAAESAKRWQIFFGIFGGWLAGSGLHWLITPINHPDASTMRVLAVWGQVAFGVVVVIANWRARKVTRRTS